MDTFKGLIYVKHGCVGTRSEGPDYYLQTTSGDFLLRMGPRDQWQPDYQLEFYSRRMVEIHGVLRAPQLIEVKDIRDIAVSLLPPMKSLDRPHLGEPVHVEAGKSVRFEQGVTLSFLEVTEESRCPPGAVCVWEGRAVVNLSLEVVDSAATPLQLTLQAGHPDLAERVALGYKVKLANLEPASRPAAGVNYVATFVVSKAGPGGNLR